MPWRVQLSDLEALLGRELRFCLVALMTREDDAEEHHRKNSESCEHMLRVRYLPTKVHDEVLGCFLPQRMHAQERNRNDHVEEDPDRGTEHPCEENDGDKRSEDEGHPAPPMCDQNDNRNHE